jgi:hypothetical protein
MNYAQAKAVQAQIAAVVERLGAVLRQFPKGPMGLPPEVVRTSAEYREAKLAYDRAFRALRKFNGAFVKEFANEIRAERRRKRRPT